MFWLYFLAIIPIVAGLVIKLLNYRVDWAEYGIGCGLAIVTAITFNCWAFYGQVGDKETLSGSIVQTRQYSSWQEYYEYAVYRTETRTGTRTQTYTYTVQVFDHWQPTKRWHNEYWKMDSNIDTDYNIPKEKFLTLSELFGGYVPIAGTRRTGEHNSRMIGGDPNDYLAINKTGYIEPVNKSAFFENRVKASHSIFKKREISQQEAKNLLPYPDSFDPFISNRLMGTANTYISYVDWEKLNGYLGPIKKINLVCIGYPKGTDPAAFDKQVAFWKGGKKNDLIIGFCEGDWSRVFSWSESEVAKSNVETLFLNPKSKTLLDDLKKEILTNFTKVNWGEKFKYISVDPEPHHVVWYMVTLIVTQAGIYILFHFQDFFQLTNSKNQVLSNYVQNLQHIKRKYRL